MKKAIIIAKLSLAATLLYAAGIYVKEPSASLRVRLVNEDGLALGGEKLFIHDDSGRENINYDSTDATGYVTLRNNSHSRVRVFGIASIAHTEEHKNYYLDRGIRYTLSKENKALNRWDPWNPEVTHVLKRIKNPVSMIIHNDFSETGFSGGRIYPGSVNEVIRYDLAEYDWLPPYGQGKEADIVVTLLTDKSAPQRSQFGEYEKRFGTEALKKKYPHAHQERPLDQRSLRVKIHFLRQGDGIFFDDDAAKRNLGGSILWHRHEAPSEGYRQDFVYDVVEDFLAPLGTGYFRVDRGKGPMYGVTNTFSFSYCRVFAPWKPGDGPRKEIDNLPHFLFSYKLNPNPASRSLEWNGVDARTGKLVRENWRENQNP